MKKEIIRLIRIIRMIVGIDGEREGKRETEKQSFLNRRKTERQRLKDKSDTERQ